MKFLLFPGVLFRTQDYGVMRHPVSVSVNLSMLKAVSCVFDGHHQLVGVVVEQIIGSRFASGGVWVVHSALEVTCHHHSRGQWLLVHHVLQERVGSVLVRLP